MVSMAPFAAVVNCANWASRFAGDAESVVVVVAEGEVEVVEAASKVPVFATEGERTVTGMQVGACVMSFGTKRSQAQVCQPTALVHLMTARPERPVSWMCIGAQLPTGRCVGSEHE